jgi:hypothetical protein
VSEVPAGVSGVLGAAATPARVQGLSRKESALFLRTESGVDASGVLCKISMRSWGDAGGEPALRFRTKSGVE